MKAEEIKRALDTVSGAGAIVAAWTKNTQIDDFCVELAEAVSASPRMLEFIAKYGSKIKGE